MCRYVFECVFSCGRFVEISLGPFGYLHRMLKGWLNTVKKRISKQLTLTPTATLLYQYYHRLCTVNIATLWNHE